MQIGITERGDAALDTGWKPWVLDGKPAILISKHPAALANDIQNLMGSGKLNVIVHATITGFGGTILEPNVPDYMDALAGYRDLIDLLGEERVVLRIDPIIPTEKGIATAEKVLNGCQDTRVRISFLDNYAHVKERFRAAGIKTVPYDFHAPLQMRLNIHGYLEGLVGREIEVCGEPGMPCTGCVSQLDLQTFGIACSTQQGKQRPTCACLAAKKELLTHRGQCKHGCLYCYWR